MSQREPAYVELWDLHDFPGVESRKTPRGKIPHWRPAPPAFMRENVEIKAAQFVVTNPSDPDFGGLVEGWIVTHGYLRVAEAIHAAASNHRSFNTEINKWVAEKKAVDEQTQGWRRGWEVELAGNPRIASFLERDPETLYDQARLTDGERAAMRLHTQLNDEGEYNSYVDVGRALKIGKEAARQRIDSGYRRILDLRGRDDAAIT